ncbi:RNA polymerase-binding protein DksA [Metallibacterium sp.]|uniref:RNA polymerase-binding protein DksA n=1 Tax=Metallibacterium sp. TaxID=2940281 RepID=UPI00261DDD0D|nr:RNA polymerase-binding protein DksA [Metallibacterium sp.]
MTKKPVTKKPVTKKPVTKKSVTKKSVTPKAASAHPAVKKTPAKKLPAGKTTAKKLPAHKPAAKPASRSAGKPAGKPAAAPMLKHAGKPAPRPAKQPAKQPARHGHAIVKSGKSATVKPVQSHPAKLPTPAAGKSTVKPSSSVNSIKAPPIKSIDDVALTRDDGRYALPASTHIDLPKGYKPKASEEYMGPRHLAYFRNKLRDWRDQLVEESRQTMDNLREEVRDVGDDAERATRETENSLELRTRDRYRKLIAKIDKALRRIEEGRYGFCEETDEDIGLERLEARPIATLSLDAQERREHLRKQIGE